MALERTPVSAHLDTPVITASYMFHRCHSCCFCCVKLFFLDYPDTVLHLQVQGARWPTMNVLVFRVKR